MRSSSRRQYQYAAGAIADETEHAFCAAGDRSDLHDGASRRSPPPLVTGRRSAAVIGGLSNEIALERHLQPGRSS
jgi:hypothetical protein